MKSIFVDTSAWYALVDADVSDHQAAVAFHTCNKIPLITTNAVFRKHCPSSGTEKKERRIEYLGAGNMPQFE